MNIVQHQISRSMAVAVAALAAGAVMADDFDLSWRTIDGGGGMCVSSDFALAATLGQPDAAAPIISGDFELTGGFWAAIGADVPVDTCLADIAPSANGNGIGDLVVDEQDLLMAINAWGPCADPNDCPADIYPLPQGDGQINVEEVLMIIGAWGPCP